MTPAERLLELAALSLIAAIGAVGILALSVAVLWAWRVWG